MHRSLDVSIDAAVASLRRGGLAIFPTETVYGVGADALCSDAVALLYASKGRPRDKPLTAHVSGVVAARALCGVWPPAAQLLAARYWPGPLTLVLPRKEGVPSDAFGGACSSTVGVRCPAHGACLETLRRFGGPVVATSANPSSHPPATRAPDARPAFAAHLASGAAALVDAGPCPGGLESTVLDLTGDTPRVLRAGPVGAAELGRALCCEVQVAAASSGIAVSPSVAGAAGSVAGVVGGLALFDAACPLPLDVVPGTVVLTHRADGFLAPPGAEVVCLPASPEGYAAALYAALHRVHGAPALYVERPSGAGPIWDAIRHRLARHSVASG